MCSARRVNEFPGRIHDFTVDEKVLDVLGMKLPVPIIADSVANFCG
jgi:hypothetical protein